MSTEVKPLQLNMDNANAFFAYVIDEYQHARTKFGPFDNGHEAYAVILEELEEVWDIVKGKDNPANMGAELVQLGAMVLAFWLELVVKEEKDGTLP